MSRILHSSALRFLVHAVSLYFEKQIPRAAAGLAYFLLLTLFPLLICVNAFLGLLNLDTADLVSYLSGFLPELSLDVMRNYLSYISVNQSGALLAAGIIMAVFSSSAAFRTLMQVMADVYEQTPHSGIRKLLGSILFPIALILTVYLSLGVIVTGRWFLRWVSIRFHLGQALFHWVSFRFFLLFFVFLLFIYGISRLAAPKCTPRSSLLVGSVISSCALVAASMLFSWFIGMSTRYSLVYGSLVSLIVLLVWLYLCGNILLLGNVFSSVWYRLHVQQSAASLPTKREPTLLLRWLQKWQ